MWTLRAIELNTQDMWNWDRALIAADYAHDQGFNTLVLGQADLLDKLVTPAEYAFTSYDDRISNQHRSRCVYLNQLALHCQKRGLAFYLQCKELTFPSELLLRHPELLDAKQGMRLDVDFWCQYLSAKIDLLMQQIPALSGLMLAISNSDSLLRFSPPSGQEIDGLPRATWLSDDDSERFYHRLFSAAAAVAHQHQKQLVLRAFPANHRDIDNVICAMEKLPARVAVSIKMTPERFWPEFPNNPALLRLNDRQVWVELELAGEEVGWGNLPFLRYEEIQGRLLWCQEKNPAIVGALCKISWEGVDNSWALGTLSEFNVFACGHFLNKSHKPVSQEALFKQWLLQRYQWQPDEQQVAELLSLLDQAHQAIYLSLYARQHVFHRHSLLPTSYGQAVWSLYGQLNRNHWLPGSGRDITFDPLQRELSSQNLHQIAKEKDEAWLLAEASQQQAMHLGRTGDMPEAFRHRWEQEWCGLLLYSRAFIHAQKAFFTLHYCKLTENNWTLREIAKTNIQALYGVSREMEDFCLQHSDLPVGFHAMFDAERARALANSLQKQLQILAK